ncbi:hypothetical protein [Acetoanaerobium sticklandii]|uniref:hypothetical protein n=1 Tax=Acetoanaerobium sticklandii TaxID=1511 RepID=UPI003A90E6FC
MKKIGFATMYSYRPHVEHGTYLAREFEKEGHTISYFVCSGKLNSCYTKELRKSDNIECIKCRIGSFESYSNNIFLTKNQNIEVTLKDDELRDLVKSSSYTLTRIENPKDKLSKKVLELQNRLMHSAGIIYENAKVWIGENNLDYVFLFNGRMDHTNAIRKACVDLGIKYCTFERTIFGSGIQINISGNCLDLTDLRKMTQFYIDKQLLDNQTKLASKIIEDRISGVGNEWRLYNVGGRQAKWPTKKSRKILILPSSGNEVMGHDDWSYGWESFLEGYEKVIEKLEIEYSECVLRAHPNWSETIGNAKGDDIADYYKEWCQLKGIHYIESRSDIDTKSLIKEADLVLLNGSSAVFEANYFRTPVVCIAKCFFDTANIATMITAQEFIANYTYDDVTKVDLESRFENCLRFLYILTYRFPQFVNKVISISTTRYTYYKPDNINSLLNMIDNGTLDACDSTFQGKLDDKSSTLNERINVKRKLIYQWVDFVRNLMKNGDR